jgi:hypothetical protein
MAQTLANLLLPMACQDFVFLMEDGNRKERKKDKYRLSCIKGRDWSAIYF